MITIQFPAAADLGLFCSIKGLSGLDPARVAVHAPDLLLMDVREDGLRARTSLWWKQVPAHGCERLGLIGHYWAQDALAGAAILGEACRVLAGHACTLAVGPMDGSTWRRYRLLTERGSEPPFLLEPDNPDDWPHHFESAGFSGLARYYSSINDDNSRVRDHGQLMQRRKAAGYRWRQLASSDIDAELERLWQLSCAGFRDNFLYHPIGRNEFLDMYAPLLAQVRPELVQFVELAGQPVAFCLALPNLLQALRGDTVDTVIVKSLAVLPEQRGKGLAAIMLGEVNRTARALGLTRTIHALMHESNPSRLLDRAVMRDFRVYTLYARPL